MKTPQLGHLSPSSSQPQQILARHGKSFYWASKFLGADLAERAAQLYLFCRYVDDLADGDLPVSTMGLGLLFIEVLAGAIAFPPSSLGDI